MSVFKDYIKIGLLVLIVTTTNDACDNPSKPSDLKNVVPLPSPVGDIRVGGVYVTKEKDGTYAIYKVLVLDTIAVHLRAYSNKLYVKPADINTDSLKILIGHAPLDRQGFLIDNPELIKVEKVKDSELEGYRLYLDAMNKSN
jgi:hypothetical protein